LISQFAYTKHFVKESLYYALAPING